MNRYIQGCIERIRVSSPHKMKGEEQAQKSASSISTHFILQLHINSEASIVLLHNDFNYQILITACNLQSNF